MVRKIPVPADFVWLDLVAPTKEELQELASSYGLHPKLVEDCLDPEHFPKFEKIEAKPDKPETTFLILRTFDSAAPGNADTVQALTRKIAIFYGPKFFITIHRTSIGVLDDLIEHWTNFSPEPLHSSGPILLEFVNTVINSYELPLERADDACDEFERRLFANHDVLQQLKAIHKVKQRLSVFRRLLWQTQGVVQKLQSSTAADAALIQDLRENVEASYVFSDDMIDSLDALVHTQLAMASHRTNEIVRLLTLFSVFFLPLTFIVGIYGMNFQNMPELRSPWGYPTVLIAMALIATIIFFWFRKKGFFR